LSDLDPELQTLDATRAAYLAHEQTWRNSSDCAALERQLADNAEHLVGQVNQIVAFGLGSLQRGKSGPEPRPRPDFQHAAMKTIAAFFGGRRKATASSVLKNDVKEIGFEVAVEEKTAVRCLIQDPWYSKIDKEFLTGIGFTVIDDPKGFVAVDARSFVMCVAPDVPVKQIVADMQWPAGMLWNTVKPPDEDRTEWETEIFDGHPCSIA
jgi:SRR1